MDAAMADQEKAHGKVVRMGLATAMPKRLKALGQTGGER